VRTPPMIWLSILTAVLLTAMVLSGLSERRFI
jgi:hypothetical protein